MRNIVTINRIFLAMYLLLLALGNEITLGYLISSDGLIAMEYRSLLWGADALLLIWCIASFLPNQILILKFNVLFSSCALVVLLFEWALRHNESEELDVQTVELETKIIRVMDRRLHHSLRPNTVAHSGWWQRGLMPEYRTTDLGYRSDRTGAVEKASLHRYRIPLIGDSYTEGLFMEYKDTFPYLMEKKMGKDGYDVEILNAGVASYYPFLHRRKLEQFYELGYKADMVMVMLDVGDIQDEAINDWTSFSEKEYEEWASQTAVRIEELKGILMGRQGKMDQEKSFRWVYPRLYGRIRDIRQNMDARSRIKKFSTPIEAQGKNPREMWPDLDRMQTGSEWINIGLARCQNNILAMAGMAQTKRSSFALVIYPHPAQLFSTNDPSSYQLIFGEWADERNIEIIDLFPPFRDLRRWRGYFVADDAHWNEKGHAVMAKALAKHLEAHMKNR